MKKIEALVVDLLEIQLGESGYEAHWRVIGGDGDPYSKAGTIEDAFAELYPEDAK